MSAVARGSDIWATMPHSSADRKHIMSWFVSDFHIQASITQPAVSLTLCCDVCTGYLEEQYVSTQPRCGLTWTLPAGPPVLSPGELVWTEHTVLEWIHSERVGAPVRFNVPGWGRVFEEDVDEVEWRRHSTVTSDVISCPLQAPPLAQTHGATQHVWTCLTRTVSIMNIWSDSLDSVQTWCVKEAQMSFTTNQTHRILKVVLRYEPFSKVPLKRWWRGRCLETWKRTQLLNLSIKKVEREYWGYKWSLNDCFHQKCSFSLVLSDSWASELTSLWC